MKLNIFFAEENARVIGGTFNMEKVLKYRQNLDLMYLDLLTPPSNFADGLEELKINVEERKQIFEALELGFANAQDLIDPSFVQFCMYSFVKYKFNVSDKQILSILFVLVKNIYTGKSNDKLYQLAVKNLPQDVYMDLFLFSKTLTRNDLARHFEFWTDSHSTLRFVGENLREKLRLEISKYFTKFSDEELRENYVRQLIKKINAEVLTASCFEDVLTLARDEINSVKALGFDISDLTLINYALGCARRFFKNEKSY